MKNIFRDINGDSNIEFYNYWSMSEMEFILFKVMRLDHVFAGSKALQIILFNFEIRIFWNN